jgi:transposase
MEVLYPIVAGLDVHRDTVVVTILKALSNGQRWKETKTFETFADELGAMVVWLDEHAVPIVAMESTGVYWKPIYRVLQGHTPGRTTWLINPTHVKNVPGRKTDVSDSHWIAQLLMHGLLSPSFLPEGHCLELRKLTRLRKKLVGDRASLTNRIIKGLEDSGVKLSGVIADVMGRSGRAMIEALLEGGQPIEQMADLARGRMKQKRAQLRRALAVDLSETSKFEIRVLLKLADELTASISALDQRIIQMVQPMRAEAERLLAVPGLKGVVVAAVLAEIGTNMSVFASSGRIVSWAGLSPGSRESAGKRMQAPTRRGSYWLRIFLVEAAWSAVRTRGTFWSRKYRSLAARLGSKQAIVAIARRILVAVYYILRDGVPYRELGPSYMASSDVERRVRYLVAQLRLLGKDVELKPIGMIA